MTLDDCPVIVSREEGFDESPMLSHVHHRAFPDLHGEGTTPREGVVLLIRVMNLALDNSEGDAWHRESLQRALSEVEGFLAGM